MAMQVIQDDSLLTFKEAMGYLRVSRSTLYRLMWSGQLTGHKVGSTWRFYREDLRACVGHGVPMKATVNPMPRSLALAIQAAQAAAAAEAATSEAAAN